MPPDIASTFMLPAAAKLAGAPMAGRASGAKSNPATASE